MSKQESFVIGEWTFTKTGEQGEGLEARRGDEILYDWDARTKLLELRRGEQ